MSLKSICHFFIEKTLYCPVRHVVVMTIARLKPILRQLLIILFMVIGVLSCRTLLMYYEMKLIIHRWSEEGLQIHAQGSIHSFIQSSHFFKEHFYIYARIIKLTS